MGSLQKGNLESLLDKAKELEKKYEWLQAAKCYGKASELVFDGIALKKADLNEGMGFCYYKASLQAKSNVEFRKILKCSIHAYEKESEILQEIKNEESKIKRIHAIALAAYARSWYETDPGEIKKLLDKWWTLENQVLKAYESSGDLYSIGRTCNDLLEYSTFDKYWLASNYSEHKEMYKECLALGEKAIKIFSKLDDKYELSRAYSNITWYYGMSVFYAKDENKLIQICQRCQSIIDEALKLSLEIDDAWLIGRAYQAAWSIAALKNSPVAVEVGKKMLEYGIVARDNYLLGFGNTLASAAMISYASTLEDPDKQKEVHEKAGEMAHEATLNFLIINNVGGLNNGYRAYFWQLARLALIETDTKERERLIEKAIKVSQEGLKLSKGWKRLYGDFFQGLSRFFLYISSATSIIEKKEKLLRKAQSYTIKYFAHAQEMYPTSSVGMQNHIHSLIQVELAKIEPNITEKMDLLTEAFGYSEKAIGFLKKNERLYTQSGYTGITFGTEYTRHGNILQQIYSLNKEKENLYKAIEAFKQASTYFKKANLPTHMAESYWHLAQLHNQAYEFHEASKYYESASKAYDRASTEIPQLNDFYRQHSLYMQAWSQIEQAKASHSIEAYEEARQNYEQAAKLHKSTSSWSYLAPNYFAWANMEEAESLSRKESTEQAKQTFHEALQNFSFAEKSIKQKLEVTTASEEKEMMERLLKASDLRQKYCQARILLEEAKLLDRDGEHLQSSKKYREAAQNISSIVDKVDNEPERKELEYVAILGRAWEKMTNAEEATSAESYVEAAELFEEAKNYCYTRKASLWVLGNSNFCKGLAAGARYQTDLELDEHNRAKGYIKNAATNYLKAGYKNASEYAKATQRLFDAYLFMNQAEVEADQEKRAKHYQMAENLLQIAAGSFMKAKQPEKTKQVQEILSNVKEEKALAVSLSQIMKAPSIASTTQSFAAPTPTGETSVGLESFEHANVQANMIVAKREVNVGESFCLSVEFVNAGREPALLMRVEEFVPSDFIVVKKPEIYRIEDTCLNMKGKQLAPLKLVEVKLTLQPSKKGKYQLNPKVYYLDELGQNKSLQLRTLEISVEEVFLEDRVSTGTQELDSLLLGGIPSEYAVVLTGPPNDKREYLIRNFLEAGIKDDEIVFYVSTEADVLETLLEKPNFYLFLCNPKPQTQIPDLPNVYKLRSKTDITNLSISIAKAYRNIDQSKKKRICVEIISDVLLDYENKATRKWISELITDLGSKGFTMLGVIDPEIHPSEQSKAIINLFDGEISLTITKDPLECKKSIRVEKLRNQDYIKNPICLT